MRKPVCSRAVHFEPKQGKNAFYLNFSSVIKKIPILKYWDVLMLTETKMIEILIHRQNKNLTIDDKVL